MIGTKNTIETALHRAEEKNLTQWEFLAINCELNVADGHARQTLSASQSKIVEQLPQLFVEGEQRPAEEIEWEAHQAYFELVGHGRFKIFDHDMSFRALNGRCMSRPVQRVASVMSRRPDR